MADGPNDQAASTAPVGVWKVVDVMAGTLPDANGNATTKPAARDSDATAKQKKAHYYYFLNNSKEFAEKPPKRERYYAIRYATSMQSIEEEKKEFALPEDELMVKGELFFLPERWILGWLRARAGAQGEDLQLKDEELRDPDRYRDRFKNSETSVRGLTKEGESTTLFLWKKLEILYRLIENCYDNRFVTCNMKWLYAHGFTKWNVTAPYKGECNAFVFGDFEDQHTPATDRYVKLKSKDVVPLFGDTGQHVYVSDTKMLAYAAGISGQNGKLGKFWVRNQDGLAVELNLIKPVDVSVTSRTKWEKRHADAINSIETDRGWSRYLDPVLNIYLVPMGDPDLVTGLVTNLMKRTGWKQVPKVLSKNMYKDWKEFNNKWQLTTKISNEQPKLLIRTGVSPFGHYETYIEEANYTDYVGTRKSRESSPKTLIEAVSAAMKTEQDKINAAHLKRTAQIKAAEKALKDNAKDLKAHITASGSNGVVLAIKVSAQKIHNARDTRSKALDQLSVMGLSATDVATEVGWTNADEIEKMKGIWPRTPNQMAEWLHRCAYSWGGISDTGTDPYFSSQVPMNLMFGTSECNSLMTRYEKAWQALLTRENARRRRKATRDELAKFEAAEKTLSTTTTRVQASFVPAQATLVSTIVAPNQKYEFNFADSTQKTLDLENKDIPDWMAFRMDYSLHQSDNFDGLKELKSTMFKRSFFPLQRPFFTKFEQELDSCILDSLYQGLDEEIEDADIEEDEDEAAAATSGALANLPPTKPFAQLFGQVDHSKDTIQEEEDRWDKIALDPIPQNTVGPNSNKRQFPYLSLELLATAAKTKNEMDNKRDRAKASEMAQANNGLNNNPPKPSSRMAARRPEIQLAPSLDVEHGSNEVTPSPLTPNAGETSGKLPLPAHIESQFTADEINITDQGFGSDAIIPQSSPFEPTMADLVSDLDSGVMAQVPIGLFVPGLNDLGLNLMGSQIAVAENEVQTLEVQDSQLQTVFPSTSAVFARTEPSVAAPSVGALPTAQDPTTSGDAEPGSEKFVQDRDHSLFGFLPIKVFSFHDPKRPQDIHEQVSFPGDLALGKLLPSEEDSPIDVIKLHDTTLTFRTRGTVADPPGLVLHTTVLLSGALQSVNAILRDVFGQDKPRLDVSCLLSSDLEAMNKPLTPVGFTLRGELPDLDFDLFDVLKILHLGVDVIATRKGPDGGYDIDYGFFGRGRISDVRVTWYFGRYGTMNQLLVSTESDTWVNVGGIENFNLANVSLQAIWSGNKAAGTSLELRGVFVYGDTQIMVSGKYSKDDMYLMGTIEKCTLQDLVTIWKSRFGSDLNIETKRVVEFTSLLIAISKQDAIILMGGVWVDDHFAANATISLNANGVSISGAMESLTISEVEIKNPALQVVISKQEFKFQLSGSVEYHGHTFKASIYVGKAAGGSTEYAVYGEYDGDFHLRDVVNELEGTFLDVSLESVAVLFSNMDSPTIALTDTKFQYKLSKGLQVFAQTSALDCIKDLLRISSPKRVTFRLFTKPTSGVGVDIQLPDSDGSIIKFDCMETTPIKLSIEMVDNLPCLYVKADLYVPVSGRPKPLDLELQLQADKLGALGTAKLKGDWRDPLGLCKKLSIHDLKAGIGINYAQFFATGTPSNLELDGSFKIGECKGNINLFLSKDPGKQLINLNIENLDVGQLLRFVGDLLDLGLNIPESKDMFFVEKLLIYASTGIEIDHVAYKRGFKLDADMTIFGKRALLLAEVNEDGAHFKGSVERFKIGSFEVRGAKAENPNFELQLSKTVQKVHIDGMIMWGDNVWIAMYLDLNTGCGTFEFYFAIKVSTLLLIQVRASLTTPIPRAIEAPNANGPPTLRQFSAGGALEDKEFKVEAIIEPHIVDGLIDLANEHLETEGDPHRKEKLDKELADAIADLAAANKALETESRRLTGVIATKTKELDDDLALLTAAKDKAKKDYDSYLASQDQDERDLKARLETTSHTAQEHEVQADTAAAQRLAEAIAKAEQCLMEWKKADFSKTTAESARTIRDAAEYDLSLCEVKFDKHVTSEPTESKSHAVWDVEGKTMASELEVKRNSARTASAAYTTALVAHNEIAYVDVTQRLLALDAEVKQAKAASEARPILKEAALQKLKQDGIDELRRLTARRKEQLDGLKKILAEATAKETARKLDNDAKKAKIKTDNDVAISDAFKSVREKQETKSQKQTACDSFSNLLDLITNVVDVFTKPLRYVIKILATKVLNIKRITIGGQFGKSTDKVRARFEGTIAFIDADFTIDFDVGNFSSFFTALWNHIKDVIKNIGGMIQVLVKKGLEALNRFIDDAKKGVVMALETAAEFVNNVGKAIEEFEQNAERGLVEIKNHVEGAIDDISQGAQAAAHDVEQVIDQIDQALQHFGEQLHNDPLGAFEDVFKHLFGDGGEEEARREELRRKYVDMQQEQKLLTIDFDNQQKKLSETAQDLKQQKENKNQAIVTQQTELVRHYRQLYGDAGLELPEFALEFGDIEHQRVGLQKLARDLGDELVDLNMNYQTEQGRIKAQMKAIQQGAMLDDRSKDMKIERQRREIMRKRSIRDRDVTRAEMEYDLRRENRRFAMKQTDPQELQNATAQMERQLKHIQEEMSLQNQQEEEEDRLENDTASKQMLVGKHKLQAKDAKGRHLLDDIVELQKWLEFKLKAKIMNESTQAPLQKRLQADASARQAIVESSPQDIEQSNRTDQEFEDREMDIKNSGMSPDEIEWKMNNLMHDRQAKRLDAANNRIQRYFQVLNDLRDLEQQMNDAIKTEQEGRKKILPIQPLPANLPVTTVPQPNTTPSVVTPQPTNVTHRRTIQTPSISLDGIEPQDLSVTVVSESQPVQLASTTEDGTSATRQGLEIRAAQISEALESGDVFELIDQDEVKVIKIAQARLQAMHEEMYLLEALAG